VFALLSAVKDGQVSEAEAIARLERTPQWVWVAMDPESKLLLALDVGDRTLAMAQCFVHHVAQLFAPTASHSFSRLAPLGCQINTAFIERLNLTIRQHVAAVGRRVTTLCKGEDGMRQQLVLFQAYYHFCLPHASLRVPLAAPIPTNGTGSAKQWQPRTPAMAAGLTDHVWTLREVLLFRVPPWPQPAGV
jgi:IS1 family transposase